MSKVYYKGFNKDMTCRGFQFKEGETYEEKEAKLCESGFHACENPLDCFIYYNPGNSVYHEVELDDVSPEKKDDDSKVCAKKIKVGARLDVAGIVKAHFDYVTERCEKVDGSVAGDNEAVAVGKKKACSAGYNGSAAAGENGSAAAGENGSAAAGENGSAAAGSWGSAAAGYNGSAAAGSWGSAAAGYRGSAAAGENGLAACRGGRVKGGMGCLLAICEIDDDGNNKSGVAVIVDGKKVKADTWYTLKDGKLVECE